MSEFLRLEAMRFLQSRRGRDKAIPRSELLHHLQLWEPKLCDRRLRDIYAALPVATCDQGLFIPRTVREVQEFKEYVSKAHGPLIAARRCNVIYSFYPSLRSSEEKQLGLF